MPAYTVSNSPQVVSTLATGSATNAVAALPRQAEGRQGVRIFNNTGGDLYVQETPARKGDGTAWDAPTVAQVIAAPSARLATGTNRPCEARVSTILWLAATATGSTTPVATNGLVTVQEIL